MRSHSELFVDSVPASIILLISTDLWVSDHSGFHVLTAELRPHSSGYDDLPSCEAWEIERYSVLLEECEGALYLAMDETSRKPDISGNHVIRNIEWNYSIQFRGIELVWFLMDISWL